MRGLMQKTEKIFEKISKLDCIKDYTLIGGTAISLQIGKRQSEERKKKNAKREKTNTLIGYNR